MLIYFLPKILALTIEIQTLGGAVYELWPRYLTPQLAHEHALAARMAATADWPAERLLAMARVESHFEPTDTSRKDGRTGKRVTSKWRSNKRAHYFVGPYFCGVLQTKALSWSTCLKQRDLRYGYALGVVELTKWMRICKRKLTCALAGHGGGMNAAKRVKYEEARIKRGGKWKGKPPYWTRVLAREQTLRLAVASSTESR